MTEALDPTAFNAFEAEGWEQQAGGYHRFFASITKRVIEPMLDAAGVGSGSRLLDLATGPGYVAAAAQKRGANPTGVDIAGEMVALATRLNPGIRFLQGDAERLPFDDGSFSAAVANFAILHVGDPERAVAELARVLEPEGRVALTVWDVPERSRLLGVFFEAITRAGVTAPADVPAGPDVFRFSDEARFEGLLSAAGFSDPEVATIEFTHRLADRDQLWRGVLEGSVRTRALVHGQSRDDRDRIRAAFDELVAPYETATGIEVPVAVKLASGRR